MKEMLKEVLIILVVSIAQVFLFLSGFNPFLILLLIPVYILTIGKNPFKRLAFSFIIALFILLLLGKSFNVSIYLLIIYILPIILYISLSYIKSYLHDFLLLCSGYLLLQVLVIRALNVIYKVDVIKETNSSLKVLMEHYFEMTGEEIDVGKLLKIMNFMMPSFIIIGSITMTFITYYISKWIVKRLKIQKEYMDFDKLFMPQEVTIGVVAFFIVQLFIKELNVFSIVITNIIIILIYLLFIQSLSLTYAILSDKIQSSVTRNLIMIILLGILIQLSPLLIFIGLLDLLFDFKKRKPKKVEL